MVESLEKSEFGGGFFLKSWIDRNSVFMGTVSGTLLFNVCKFLCMQHLYMFRLATV